MGHVHLVRHRTSRWGRIHPQVPVVGDVGTLDGDLEVDLRRDLHTRPIKADRSKLGAVADGDRMRRQRLLLDDPAMGIPQTPNAPTIHGLRSEVRDLGDGLERLIGRPDPLGHAQQGHGRPAEAGVLGGRDIALLVPEGIEHAHQSRALARKIVQIQQLESADARRAQLRLDILPVAQGLQLARGDEEIVGLVEHVVGRERIAKDLEVGRAEYAGVLGDLIEVGIYAPLADLMTDHGRLVLGDKVTIVRHRLRRAGVDPAAEPLAPGLDSRRGCAVILVFGDDRPAGGAGVQPPRVLAFPVGHQVSQPAPLISARRLVPVGQHAEGWVIAVRLEDPIPLGIDERVDRFALPDARTTVRPSGTFDLEIHAHFVRRGERRLRRTPRMKPDVVQPVRLGNAQNPQPFGLVRRGIACLRKDAALQRAAQDRLAPVDCELRALRGEPTQSECGLHNVPVHSDTRFGAKHVQIGRKLVPQSNLITQDTVRLDVIHLGRTLERHFAPDQDRPIGMRSDLEGDHPPNLPAGGIPYVHPDDGRPSIQIGPDLHILDPHPGPGPQFQAPYDPVPVALRMVRDAVRVDAHADLDAVVHADSDPMHPRFQRPQVVHMRTTERIPRPDRSAVHPDLRLPVTPLQRKLHAPILPARRDPRQARVPGRALVVLQRGQPERHLDLARLAIRRVLRLGEPGTIHDAARPGRIDGNLVAQAVFGQ